MSIQARAEALVNQMKARPWLNDRRVNALRQRTQELKAEEDALWAERYKLRKREALKRQEASLEASLIALEEWMNSKR